MKILVTDRNGEQRWVQFEPNYLKSLMELLKDEGFDVIALCGGNSDCGTCHVCFDELPKQIPEADNDELSMLDSLPNVEENSRLSCQIPLMEGLDGSKLHVLGEE